MPIAKALPTHNIGTRAQAVFARAGKLLLEIPGLPVRKGPRFPQPARDLVWMGSGIKLGSVVLPSNLSRGFGVGETIQFPL